MPCKRAAIEVIEPAFKLEIESLDKKYAKIDLGQAGQANYVARTFDRLNSNFKKNIELSFKSYVGSNIGAENLIRQQMMINAIKNYADDYGYARASSTQESNWRIAGDLAGTYLPILMSVLKGLIYSSFIFMLPILIMSGGFAKYLSYLTLVASLQLWAPLNAVLTMFIDIYSSTTLQGIADQIVSFSTMSRIGNYTDKIVAVASGLQMAIPFLAFSIIQGGVGGFINLAGTITGASQSAASQAANESVTNNKSFDNYSVGNQQLYNQGGFKTDWNESYASGSSSYQHMDGTQERVTGSGNILMQKGVGFTASAGATAYKKEDSHSVQANTGTQIVESLHNQDSRSVSNAKSNLMSNTADHVAHLAQREHAGESFNYDSMGEQGKTFQQAVNHTKQLHDKHGYGWQQSAGTAVEAIATYGTPLKDLTGFGVSGSIKGSMDATNSSDQSVGQDILINRDNDTNESYNNLVKAASNSSWAKENSIDTSYSDAVRNSYEELQRFEQQESMSKQKVDDWHQAQMIVNANSASASTDMYQEVVDGVKQDYGVDVATAQKMADRRSPEAQKVWQKLQNSDHYVQNIVAKIAQDRESVSGAKATEQLDQFTNQHEDKVASNPKAVISQQAREQGMELDGFKGQIQQRASNLFQEHQKMTNKNTEQYKNIKQYNEQEEKIVAKQVKKYEEDRIGKGFIGTVGGIIDGVGNPNDKK